MAVERSNEVNRAASPRLARERSEPSAKSDRPAASDRVDVSSGAREIASLAATALQAAEVRSERVEALREQISEGRYRIASKQLAASLIRNDVVL